MPVFIPSKSLPEAKRSVVRLYRQCLKALPTVQKAYQLVDLGRSDLVAAVRTHFRQNQHVTDPKVIDVLRFQAEEEFYDTTMVYKTKYHVLELLTPAPKLEIKKPHNESLFNFQFFEKS